MSMKKQMFVWFCLWIRKASLVGGLFLMSGIAVPAWSANSMLTHKTFKERPKLVVVVVIDQFRADYLTRFEKVFLAAQVGSRLGGFNYLMGKSAYFPFAKYDVLQSMTCPGHATILTGSYPAQNGISLNEWFDRNEKRNIYCVEDKEDGLSPRKLNGTTVSDELKNAGGHSKVISIALKDRAAIMLGGHRADAAFWLSDDLKWESSKYYFAQAKIPDWLEKYNIEIQKHKGEKYIFKSTGKGSGMSEVNSDFERETTYGSKYSLAYPYGLKVTTDMAIRALKEYKLGLNSSTDFLTISYSSHDFLGHDTGANNREMEELTLAEDQNLADLINAIRAQLKSQFKDVVFVLTGDHGVSPNVKYLKDAKIDAGFIDSAKLVASINQKLDAKYGAVTSNWLMKAQSFNFYLNLKAAADKKIAVADLEEFVKAEIQRNPGVAAVFSKSDFFSKNLPSGQNERQILKTFNPLTNGDVVLIPKAFYMESGHNSTHMTGYNYDRMVPLLILAKNMKAGVYSTSVELVDLAPTLSFLLGILPPALSEGRVLNEAF
jgi:predicted AlkP superfamily pyrophosphatase or phosphodiesterase